MILTEVIFWVTELSSSGRKEEEGDHQSAISASAVEKKAIGRETATTLPRQGVATRDPARLREEDTRTLTREDPPGDIPAAQGHDQGPQEPHLNQDPDRPPGITQSLRREADLPNQEALGRDRDLR